MQTGTNLTWGQFCEVTQFLDLCAAHMLAESRTEFRRVKKNPNAKVYDYEIEKLMDCYKDSVYGKDASEEYIVYVKKQARKVIKERLGVKFRNLDRLRIMTPVIFYALIVLNESNPSTVESRRKKVALAKEKADAANTTDKERKSETNQAKTVGPWKQTNPYLLKLKVYQPDDEIKLFEADVMDISKKATDSGYGGNPFIADIAKTAAQEIHYLDGHFHYVQYINDISAAGAFLHDVLIKFHNPQKPLDTILRMYCVMQMQETLTGCRLLTDALNTVVVDCLLKPKQYISNDVAMVYALEKLGFDLAHSYDFNAIYEFPIVLGYGKDGGVIEVFKSEQNKKGFSDYYKFLLNNFCYDMPMLIEMFFNKERLAPFFNSEDKVKQYVQAQNVMVNSLATMKKREIDFATVLTTIDKVKNCQHVLSLQPYISENDKQENITEEQHIEEDTIDVGPIALAQEDYEYFYGDDSLDFDEDVGIHKDRVTDNVQGDELIDRLGNELCELFIELGHQGGDTANILSQEEHLKNSIQQKLKAFRTNITASEKKE